MPPTTATNGKTKPETWLDWQHVDRPDLPDPDDDDLLTREELLDHAKVFGFGDITARTFQSWQTLGLIPKPVTKWHNGAPRALYPDWLPFLLPFVQDARRAARRTEEIAAEVRARVPRAIENALSIRLTQATPALEHIAEMDVIQNKARIHERVTGKTITGARIVYLDENDDAVSSEVFRWSDAVKTPD